MQTKVRAAAVAGSFYPGDREGLLDGLRAAFADAVTAPHDQPVPKALIVPHAGYLYSGAVAASAYRRLVPARSSINRVVLIGPSHRSYLDGIGVSGADAFATPLGVVPLARDAREVALAMPGVELDDAAHAQEHSLEVQLPFLQVVLDDFELLALVTGRSSPDEVTDVLDAVWGGPETVVVCSTDLSHYNPYDDAVALDQRTATAIVAGDADGIGDHDACGAVGLRGLLVSARSHVQRIEQLDLRNSGDTAGDRRRVVGYGAFALT